VLENTIIDLINRTPGGQSIRVSLYGFGREAPAVALLEAQARGVDVGVIMDGTNEGPPATVALTTLRNGLSPQKPGLPANKLRLCRSGPNNDKGSCLGVDKNHSKFYLFSATNDGSTNIVVQSSANLIWSQLAQFNNLVIARGDAALYDGYLAYWKDQNTDAPSANYYESPHGSVVGTLPILAYFFPRASGDTILSVLGNVQCTGNKSLRIVMAFFSDGRLAVAKKLAQMAAGNLLGLKTEKATLPQCKVEAILRAEPDTSPNVVDALEEGGVTVRVIGESETQSTVHSKYMLIDSDYDVGNGAKPRKLVFTGSHNYTYGALRLNDEQLIRVEDAGIYAAFDANWTHIRSQLPP
jgi:hypothetical protein